MINAAQLAPSVGSPPASTGPDDAWEASFSARTAQVGPPRPAEWSCRCVRRTDFVAEVAVRPIAGPRDRPRSQNVASGAWGERRRAGATLPLAHGASDGELGRRRLWRT